MLMTCQYFFMATAEKECANSLRTASGCEVQRSCDFLPWKIYSQVCGIDYTSTQQTPQYATNCPVQFLPKRPKASRSLCDPFPETEEERAMSPLRDGRFQGPDRDRRPGRLCPRGRRRSRPRTASRYSADSES